MNNLNHVQIKANNTFEQSVYSKFPTCLHEHVEHELFYNGVELEEGQLTMEEFTKGVLNLASYHEQWQAQLEQDKLIFAGLPACCLGASERNSHQRSCRAPPLQ